MLHKSIENTDPKLLGKIMSAPEECDVWAAQDLAAMVRHQLAAPLLVDLEAAFPGEGQRVAALAGTVQPPVVSFGDLLVHASPPVELLRMVKEMAKRAEGSHEHPLPMEVASYFYFASIAAAQRRTGQRISSLSDDRVREGLAWLLGQAWLDGPARRIAETLREGM